jgi:glycosyltransferase involved in cell wall biosynthesis
VKIAHVTDFYLPRLGGIEVHVHDLSARQRAAGHTVDIITSSPPDPAGVTDEPHVHRIGQGLRWRHPLNPAAAVRVHDVLRDSDYDVVHAHGGVWSSLSFAGALSAVDSGIPAVLTWHSLLDWATPLYRLVDWTIDYTTRPIHWTAVSASATRPLYPLLPAGTEVGVVPNAVDVQDWRMEPVCRDPREVHVVAVMRLAPRKRPLHLLKMLRRVRERLPADIRMRTTIIGEGPERPTLERFLRRHRMQPEVTLTGRLTRERIRETYRTADVFVAPATLESFGIAALEARCAGLPVVAMRASGIADFVTDGVDGLLADSDQDMVEALFRLSTDAGLRTVIAGHNRDVPPPFGWPEALETTEKAYARAAELAGVRRSQPSFYRVLRAR